MKKVTVLVAALMIAGFSYAQDGGKACCKKGGGKCSKECHKGDKKADSKSGEKKSAPAPKG